MLGPTVQFISKINLSFVNQQNGKVGQYNLLLSFEFELFQFDPIYIKFLEMFSKAQKKSTIINIFVSDYCKIPSLKAWHSNYTMKTVLNEIRRQMCDKSQFKLKQPPEGSQIRVSTHNNINYMRRWPNWKIYPSGFFKELLI